MIPFHITGHAGCGKTTLITDLIRQFLERGIQVGTMKHSAHVHELDKPGKDSFCHWMMLPGLPIKKFSVSNGPISRAL